MNVIKHEGVMANRLRNPYDYRERVFAEAWREQNNPPSFLNLGVGTLAWLLHTEYKETFLGGVQPLPDPSKLTQEEVTVAATVIQWLGTNVGFSFLEETLRKLGYQITPMKNREEIRKKLMGECTGRSGE